MTLIGTFKVSIPTAALASLGVILSAGYALWLYRKVVFGALTKRRSPASRTDIPREPVGYSRGVPDHPVRRLSEAGARHVGASVSNSSTITTPP